MQQCVFFGGGVAVPPYNVDVPRVHARHRFFRKFGHFVRFGGVWSNCVQNVTTLCHCSSNHITLIIA